MRALRAIAHTYSSCGDRAIRAVQAWNPLAVGVAQPELRGGVRDKSRRVFGSKRADSDCKLTARSYPHPIRNSPDLSMRGNQTTHGGTDHD